MTEDNSNRQRKRVPISCLNCKRRKVKCDRQKPSCGGCLKNGVGHLCEYLEPHWTSTAASGINGTTAGSVAAANGSSVGGIKLVSTVNGSLETEKLKQLDELRQLRLNHERIISSQRKEIEDLKRQLSFNHQLTTENKEYNDDSSQRPVTILNKLNQLAVIPHKESLELYDPSCYLIKLLGKRDYFHVKDLYSWTSIIKLDHRLSGLWHKINNMQRLYHLYKSNMKNNFASKLKITEIDFTSSSNSKHQDHECPVVLCDLNFMNEYEPNSSQKTQLKPSSIKNSGEKFQADATSSDSILSSVHELWLLCLKSLRDEQTLNPTQLKYLLDFYFADVNKSITSRDLLLVYREEIYGTFTVDDNHKLALCLPETNEPLVLLQTKGVYVSLLKLVVDETLEILRSKVRNKMNDEYSIKFQSLFPSELAYICHVNHIADGLASDKIQSYLSTYLVSSSSSSVSTKMNKSVPVIACLLLLLAKAIEIRKPGVNGNQKETNRFKPLLELLKVLFDEKSPAEIWNNPAHISFPGMESKKRVKDIRLHFCHLWNEFVRCLNVFTFSLVAHEQEDMETTNLILRAYQQVEAVQANEDDHMKYIQSLKSSQLNELATSLKVNYLLANVQIFLHRGMQNILGPKVNIKELDNLIGGCGSWIEDARLNRLIYTKGFESKTMLHFCNIYVTYIIFLQAEEDRIENLKEDLIITLFIKMDSFFKYTESILTETANCKDESQYFYSALSEIFVPVIQILIALLFRVCQRPKEKNENLLKQLSTMYYSMSSSVLNKEKSINNLLRGHLSNFVSSLIKSLYLRLSINKNHTLKLLRLWEFYLTILDGASKLDFNYSRLHTHVPDFKKMIGTEPGVSNFDKCPIAHVKPGASNYSSVNLNLDESVSFQGNAKKCPIDHTKLMTATSSKGGTERSSNIESGTIAKKPKLENHDGKKNNYDPRENNSNTGSSDWPSMDNNNEQLANGTDNITGYPAIDFDFNFNALSNLNLDFLQDYSILETFQDPNQKAIEDLFQ